MSSVSEKKSQQVYIGKLPRNFTEEDLKKEFDKFGTYSGLTMKRGYAFIVSIN